MYRHAAPALKLLALGRKTGVFKSKPHDAKCGVCLGASEKGSEGPGLEAWLCCEILDTQCSTGPSTVHWVSVRTK